MPVFEGVLEPARGGGAYVVLPDEVWSALGRSPRCRVRGRFAGVELRSATAPMGGGRVCVGVHKATRLAAGVGFGETAVVELDVDVDPRVVEELRS